VRDFRGKIVSAAEGWCEHVQASWPAATARIQKCDIDPYYPHRSSRQRSTWYINCNIAYVLGAEEIVTKIRSGTAPEGDQVGLMNEWVNTHPPQSVIVVHYDPSNHRNAVLTSTDMPMAGRRTPNNLRLLLIAVASSVVMISIARLMGKWPQTVPTT
jgi:hypothetical protein